VSKRLIVSSVVPVEMFNSSMPFGVDKYL